MAGEYTGQVMLEGITRFLEAACRTAIPMKLPLEAVLATETPVSDEDIARLMAELPPRPAGLCTGCPERPLFSAIKQLQEEMDKADIFMRIARGGSKGKQDNGKEGEDVAA